LNIGTAGGLVLDQLGRLARPGDSVTVDGHRLTVLRADPTRIRKDETREQAGKNDQGE
jgi:CBS domain containing-hemolysin-like protein